MLHAHSDIGAKEFCAWTTLHRSVLTPELSVDFVLPDYYGDIRRILHVFASPRLDGTFCEGSHLEYDGTVSFSILYLTEEDCLRNLTFSESFGGELEIAGMQPNDLLSVLPTVETTTCRVQSPRKLTLKCKLQIGVCARQNICLTPGFDGHYRPEDEATVTYDRSEIATLRMLQFEEKDLMLSEEFSLDSSMPAIGEIIRSDVILHLQECRPTSGELICRGDAILNILYRTEGTHENEQYTCFNKKIPLHAVLTDAELTDRFACRGIATPAACRVMPQTNSYGEMRVLSVELTYDLLALCSINDKRAVTKDIFSTKYPCDGDFTQLPVTRLIGCQKTNFSVTEAKPRSAIGAEAAGSVLEVLGDVKPDDLTYDKERGRLCFSGKATVCVLLQNGEDSSISEASMMLPIRCELPCPQQINSGEEFECTCKLISAEGRLDSTNLLINLEVALDVGSFATEAVSLVQSIRLDTAHPFSQDTPAMLLYYPGAKERVWEIAKRFHITPDSLLAANRIDAQGVSEAGVLLIPRS